MSTASVMLKKSSFFQIVSNAPRTLPPTSPDPRCSTPSELHDGGLKGELVLIDFEKQGR